MFSKQQTEQIKNQLIEQLNNSFPESKKQEAIIQINAMNEKELEEFLAQNNLIKKGQQTTECIFCSITKEEVPSQKIEEDDFAIAVLEINPLSKGHTLIIPKEHSTNKEELLEKSKKLIEKISKKIKKNLKAEDINISPANLFGHEILNLIPTYKEKKTNSERKKTTNKELKEILEAINKVPKKKIVKKTKKLEEKKIWLPQRTP